MKRSEITLCRESDMTNDYSKFVRRYDHFISNWLKVLLASFGGN